MKFKCIQVFYGYKRRYARLGELIGTVSSTRKVYPHQDDKIKAAKLAKKVKKKRKIKARRKRQQNMRPYLGLLVALKKATRRYAGFNVTYDTNRMMTFTEPTRFGPAGKSENIPNFVGTLAYGPVSLEVVKNETIRTRFKSVIRASRGIV